MLVAVTSIGVSRPSIAFAPEAATAVAARISSALPPAARWESAWDATAAAAVEARLAREADDPEGFAPLHRTVADAVTTAAGATAPEALAVTGLAPVQLAAAATALREAFAAHDPARAAGAMAWLAVAAADLADPFQTTSPDRDEVAGARARFSDLLSEADLTGLEVVAAVAVGDPAATALSFASESASRRAAVELAVSGGDGAALIALRRERLQAALAVSRALALQAWRQAGAPALVAPPAAGALRAWPNPVRDQATLSFELPARGEVTFELFDLQGRRVWSRGLGVLEAGPRSAALAAGELRAVAPGLYLARVTAAGYSAVGRFTTVAP